VALQVEPLVLASCAAEGSPATSQEQGARSWQELAGCARRSAKAMARCRHGSIGC